MGIRSRKCNPGTLMWDVGTFNRWALNLPIMAAASFILAYLCEALSPGYLFPY